jgi:GNAT superfamily N-acetyltransferase
MRPNGSIRVRSARPDDARGIGGVYVDAWRETYAGILPDRMLIGMSRRRQERQWRFRIERCARRGSNYDKVKVAVAPVNGVIAFSDSGPSRDPGLNYDAEVYTLYVHPNYLDFGVGGRLLAEMFRDLADAGAGSAIIWALADNPYRHFYHAMGGSLAAERMSVHWGRRLREVGYGWRDLTAACAKMDRRASTPESDE